ncbi:MAG: type II and III secretion system protein family protein [Bryobacteraceae bacterium]
MRIAVAALFFACAMADTSDSLASRAISLTVGKGNLLQFSNEVLRVAVAEPKIADAIVVSPREVMLNAKGVGKTTVVVWETGASPMRYEINVISDTSDLDSLRQELKTIAGAQIAVNGTPESLVLTGSVTNPDMSKRLQALAATHAKTVVNLLETPAATEPRQIMLEVKFASVDRSRLSDFGFNLFSRNPGGIGETSTQQFQQPRFSQLQFQNQDFSNTTVNFADILNLFYFRADLNIGATIRALQGRNVLQILAEPNLIAVEGKTASFLAGGQFPFPTITSTTTGGATAPVVTVQFKPFGVQLDFTPTILTNGSIYLKVSPEVSSLDFTNAVQLQGFLIPALTTRRAETEVVLKDGETFAIAGLIDNRVTQVLNKVRGLGDIPILGTLFKSRSTQKSNDELLVVITPHFVRPLAPGEKPRMPLVEVPFLPTVEQENDKKKGVKAPEFVGPRGHQEP